MVRQHVLMAVLIAMIAMSTGRNAIGQGEKTAPTAGSADFLTGVNAMDKGDYPAAIAAFSDAIEQDEENPDYYLSRGVANLLAEKIPQALKDLQRASRLDGGSDRETRMWLAAAERMGGNIFTETFPQSTRDRYESLVGDGSAFYGDVNGRQQREPEYPPSAEERARGYDWFSEAAKLFAEKRKSTVDLGPAMQAGGIELFQQQKYAEALASFDFALKSNPNDLELAYLRAQCLAQLNDWSTARQSCTRILWQQPLRGEVYLSRAMAAARMGDVNRARSDLDAAARHHAANIETLRPEIQKAIDSMQEEQATDPATYVTALEAAARAGKPWKELAAVAKKVHHSMDSRRLRLDETYQYRLRELHEALAADPNNADRLAAIAEYMNSQIHPWGGRVEPRTPFTQFRTFNVDAEIATAESYADRAIAINSNQAQALVTKAHVRIRLKQYADAETLLKQAMSIRDDIPEMLDLYAGIMAGVASAKSYNAHNLRSPKHWSEDRDEGDWRVTYYYTRYPTADELAMAEQLENESKALFAMAESYMKRMIELRSGTADGWYYQGEYERWKGDVQAACRSMEQAVQLDPKHIKAWEALAEMYANLDQSEKALEAHSNETNVIQTNAIGFLRIAWGKIDKTAYKSAGAALDRAMQLDPTDARIYAYRGVIAEQQEKPEDAIVFYRMVLAMEDARLRRMGNPLPAKEMSHAIDPQELGLAMVCGVKCGDLLTKAEKSSEAIEVLQLIADLQNKIPREQWPTRLYLSMLPDQVSPDDPNFVPEAVAASTWLAAANVAMAQSALNQEKQDLAEKYFVAAAALEAPGEPGARARIGLARLYLSQDRYEGAMKVLHTNTSGTFSREIQSELNDINMQIAQGMNKQQDQRDLEQQQETERIMQEQWNQYEQERQQRIEEINRQRQEKQKNREQRQQVQQQRQQRYRQGD
jgi:Tfp pilus assembly protein PilF